MKENFLILTFLDDHWEITVLRADFSKKELEILATQRESSISNYKLNQLSFSSFYLKPPRVLLVLDSKKALTNFETISLIREEPRRAIDEADAENLISQALWKVFDKGRTTSAKQFGLGDLDVMLANVRIYDFRIDGHRTITPLKHKGKRVDIYLSQTFVDRLFFNEIISKLPRYFRLALVCEGGAVGGHITSRIVENERFVFAKVMARRTDLFFVKRGLGGQIFFLDHLEWGKDYFYAAIARDLKIGSDLTGFVLRKFISHDVSPHFSRKFSQVSSRGIATLIRALQNAIKKTKCRFAYFDFHPLIPSNIFPKMILPIDSERIMDVFGFRYPDKLDFLSLAAVIEFYLLPKEDLVNHLGKRRMRWLMP